MDNKVNLPSSKAVFKNEVGYWFSNTERFFQMLTFYKFIKLKFTMWPLARIKYDSLYDIDYIS